MIKGKELSGNVDKEKFTITGNTLFKSNEIEANADKIIYDMTEEMAYLEGNVKGKQNDRKFSAEKISIDLKKEKIELSGKAKLIFPDRGEE